MLRIGLTGGIGSGKTTVSDRFARLNVPVIDTDLIARAIVAPGLPANRQIQASFGDEVLLRDGSLNREALRQRVFDDADQRARLEGILHPAIKTEVTRRLQELSTPYCVIVVPLLIETDFTDLVDRILVVDTPDERRRAWIQDRSGLSELEIEKIFAAQISRAERLARADDVIENDSTLSALYRKIDRLHQRYLYLAGSAYA